MKTATVLELRPSRRRHANPRRTAAALRASARKPTTPKVVDLASVRSRHASGDIEPQGGDAA
jgi:hypothetical protein